MSQGKVRQTLSSRWFELISPFAISGHIEPTLQQFRFNRRGRLLSEHRHNFYMNALSSHLKQMLYTGSKTIGGQQLQEQQDLDL